MSKFSRIVVLVTALASLFAVLSSTAGAVTFTNTGGTSFHGTGGAGTLSVTGSGGTNNLSCTSGTATGTIPAGVFTTVTGTATLSPCSLSGTATHVNCSFTLVPTVFSAGAPAVTSGLGTVTCTARLAATGTPLCHVEGTGPGHYVNPVLPNTVGRVTLTASSTATVTHANGTSSCSSLLGTAASGIGHLAELTATLTGPASSNPFITSP
jgi:hypothetical protein